MLKHFSVVKLVNTTTRITLILNMLYLLPNELHDIILSYLCPTEENPHVLLVLTTKFKTFAEWTKSREIITQDTINKIQTQITYVNGKIHRASDDKPALECSDGFKEWWINNKLHRIGDKPAREYANGSKEWWINGKRHRDNGKPAAEYTNGLVEWWTNGQITGGNATILCN